MQKYILSSMLLFMSAAAVAQADAVKSAWLAKPVTVDGNPKEWTLPLRFYDADTKLFFAFTNDDKNLYLCFQSPDEINEMKIMQAGMEVSLSAKGKHKVSIDFPLPKKEVPAATRSGSGAEQNFDRIGRRAAFLDENRVMKLSGFATRNGLVAINDSSGINAAINWDSSNRFTCEISIPLKEFFGKDYNENNLLKDISMDVEVGAVRHPATGAKGGGGDFSEGERGGRMGGRGHNREQGSNENESNAEAPGQDRMYLYQKSKMKQKFTLAQDSHFN
jgi:hypothetical protein